MIHPRWQNGPVIRDGRYMVLLAACLGRTNHRSWYAFLQCKHHILWIRRY